MTRDPTLSVRVSFQAGRVINSTLPNPLLFLADTTAEHPPPDFTKMVIPVMSIELVEALRARGVDNLQTFPAVLENPATGERWANYRAVNIVGVIACADMKQSQYVDIGGTGVVLVDFTKLVIQPAKALGALCFRLAESSDILLVHESVRDHLLSSGRPRLNGMQFEAVRES